MLNKSLLIAAGIVIVTVVPVYFYLAGNAGFLLESRHLPILSLALFVLIFVTARIAAGKSGTAKPRREHAQKPAHNPENDGPREGGNVKWFNASKGFGFITRDSGDDVFVHFRSIRGDGHRVLYDGQRVEFFVSQGDKGLQAEDVAVAN